MDASSERKIAKAALDLDDVPMHSPLFKITPEPEPNWRSMYEEADKALRNFKSEFALIKREVDDVKFKLQTISTWIDLVRQ